MPNSMVSWIALMMTFNLAAVSTRTIPKINWSFLLKPNTTIWLRTKPGVKSILLMQVLWHSPQNLSNWRNLKAHLSSMTQRLVVLISMVEDFCLTFQVGWLEEHIWCWHERSGWINLLLVQATQKQGLGWTLCVALFAWSTQCVGQSQEGRKAG